jgi:SEC-C motif-containing protein
MKKIVDKNRNPCPCESGKAYVDCCAVFHQGEIAPTAEALMRSRYSAYVMENEAYLRATWDERTLPSERIIHDEKTQWLGLQVKRHESQAESATVEFIARYKIAGRAHRLHEVSRFVKHEGRWYYVDGIHQ